MTAVRHRTESGQAMGEYLVVCLALALALFTPWIEGTSVASMLARSLVTYMRGLSFITSIL